MRIIGGTRRGVTLIPFAGRAIRPTADRLRESLFNIIGPLGDGCRVLDLFAGTGALGIEALSRGAAEAFFIDNDPKALALIKRNLERSRFADRGRIFAADIAKGLGCLGNLPRCLDLVFVDPPYEQGLVATALTHLAQSRALADQALVVVEHAGGQTLVTGNTSFVQEDCRRYGKTLVSFFRYMV